MQLLIKANQEPRKKLELVKSLIDLGADIHSADKSGLTPYQVAIAEDSGMTGMVAGLANLFITSPAMEQMLLECSL